MKTKLQMFWQPWWNHSPHVEHLLPVIREPAGVIDVDWNHGGYLNFLVSFYTTKRCFRMASWLHSVWFGTKPKHRAVAVAIANNPQSLVSFWGWAWIAHKVMLSSVEASLELLWCQKNGAISWSSKNWKGSSGSLHFSQHLLLLQAPLWQEAEKGQMFYMWRMVPPGLSKH